MPRNAQETLGSLQQLKAALAANAAGLPKLEGQRQQFDDMVSATLEAFTHQGALRAEKQKASQTLQNLLSESSRLATVLRFSLKSHYGIRSEKLVEFGLQPFRGRKPVEPAEPDSALESTPAAPGLTVQ